MARVGDGHQGLGVSGDGRFVVFRSQATDLVPGDTNAVEDIFVRDRQNATIERVSVGSSGGEANADSSYPSITDDGRFVVFNSSATNLVPGDANGYSDVFLRDRQAGTTERMSVSSSGTEGNGDSYLATISADGRLIAFVSSAANLVAGDSNGYLDAFVHDRQTGATQRVSVASDGTQGDGECLMVVISGVGRHVAFMSSATNLVPGDANGLQDIFVRDVQTGTTERISVSPAGTDADGDSGWPNISDDGRLVSYRSNAGNLVPGSSFYHGDVFVHDRLNGTTEIASTTTGGALANAGSGLPSMSGLGRYVVFRSLASDLVPGDTNGFTDIFLHDREAAGFTTLCDPGQASVIACPCGNQPSGSGRGCNNSYSTGGATLGAAGIAYLSLDTLVFGTLFEPPSATSILLQGSAALPTGVVFGQGVRCAGGTLKRLYVKAAVNGSITAPNPNGTDPSVSARSAALGLPIQPGEPRYYQVFYRDPTVLGGCPSTSTFNVTQSGSVSWWP
jgi:Tol biopolymer transport system component